MAPRHIKRYVRTTRRLGTARDDGALARDRQEPEEHHNCQGDDERTDQGRQQRQRLGQHTVEVGLAEARPEARRQARTGPPLDDVGTFELKPELPRYTSRWRCQRTVRRSTIRARAR